MIEIYQVYLDEYSDQFDIFDKVYYVCNQFPGHEDTAFESFNTTLRDLMKYRYDGKVMDYTPDMFPQDALPNPDTIVNDLMSRLLNYPDHKVLFAL